LRQREAAEDLTQEVFLRAYLKLDTLEKPAKFAAWLHQMARNLAVDWQRREISQSALLGQLTQQQDAQMNATPGHRDVRHELNRFEESDYLNQALEQLPDDQRELLLLHHAEGLSCRDIADRIGVHYSTVNRRLNKALKDLKTRFDEELLSKLRPLRSRAGLDSRTVAIVFVAAGLSGKARQALAATAGEGVLLSSSAASSTAAVAGEKGSLFSIVGALWGNIQALFITSPVAVVVGSLTLFTAGVVVLSGGWNAFWNNEYIMKENKPLRFFVKFGNEATVLHPDDPLFPGKTIVRVMDEDTIEVAQEIAGEQRAITMSPKQMWDTTVDRYYAVCSFYYDPLCEYNLITDPAYRNCLYMVLLDDGIKFVSEFERNAEFGQVMVRLEKEKAATMKRSDWLQASLDLAIRYDFLPEEDLHRSRTITTLRKQISDMRNSGE
jgi:RNA polymerase sigma-70 factor (ECF subfamily)